ncbi:MAG: zinc-finger domain-containing protein [Betaproteobacteria bacterium]
MTIASADAAPAVAVAPQDLPVFCPNPRMPLWSSHPRVFLDVTATGDAMCPYCGTRYRLAGGAPAGGGH